MKRYLDIGEFRKKPDKRQIALLISMLDNMVEITDRLMVVYAETEIYQNMLR